MLLCLRCQVEKPFEDFFVKRGRPRGYQSYCKPCAKENTKISRQKNPEQYRASNRRYYAETSEQRVAGVLKSRENNREAFNTYQRQYSKDNPTKVLAWNRAKELKRLKRVPSWLSLTQKEEILGFYRLAKDLEATTGERYQVDHIVPLNGKNVSGLHVPWNLQVLPATVNNRKSNKFVGGPAQ